MNYEEAESLVRESGLYASPDFYRMQFTESVALGLRDEPVRILADVQNYGTVEACEALQKAIEDGTVVPVDQTVVNPELPPYLTINQEFQDAPVFLYSHMAMAIAFPKKYEAFFGGPVTWEPNNPHVMELLELCISCLTNKAHPSDIYGEHEIPEKPKGKRGPKPGTKRAPRQETETSEGYKNWARTREEYNAQLSLLWSKYLQACAERKENIIRAKRWRDAELEKLRQQMTAVSNTYEEGIAAYNDKIEQAKQVHHELKLQGAPRREDF